MEKLIIEKIHNIFWMKLFRNLRFVKKMFVEKRRKQNVDNLITYQVNVIFKRFIANYLFINFSKKGFVVSIDFDVLQLSYASK